jgi:murein DD-endopeptidase MepM/ murein hydrolase activator NlpD
VRTELRRHAPIGRARRQHAGARPRGLPHLYAARNRRPLPDLYIADKAEARRGGRFRWFFSTCLAGAVGAVAIAAVVLGSLDSRDGGLGMLPSLRRATEPQARPAVVPGPAGDGLRWSAPKSDRLQLATGAASTRFIVQDTINQIRGNREYMYKKPYARVVLRLGAVTADPAIELPPFNPLSFYGAEGEAADKDALARAQGGEVTFRVVELLGSILPTEDGQEMNGQEAAELIKRSSDTPRDETGMRPTFVPEGAQIALQRPDARRSPRSGPEATAPYTSVLEKSTQEADDPTASGTDQPHSASLYASLYYGAFGQGVSHETVLQILRVHAHVTDFRKRARPTDVAELFFDLKEEEKGADSPPGELLYTAMSVAGDTLRFFRFRTSDGVVDFYDEHGSNSRKFLMRQPVRSEEVRLTSGFGMRFHPLLNQRKLHTGVDWSAPPGSPIMAAGNGVIEEAQYKGQLGNHVRIRHANGYTTIYGHLSRFGAGIRDGVKVRQGQIIGYVGSTGLSTGPHLHYEVLIGDRYVDPVKIPMPVGRKLSGRQLQDFMRERARIEDLMRRPPVRVVQVDSK